MATTSEQLLTLLLNSLTSDQLPVITSLSNTDKVLVFNTATSKTSTILKENLSLTGASGTSSKISITIEYDGQTSYTLTSKPDNIDLVIGRIHQYQNVDYTYNPQSGALVITNTSVGASIRTTSLFDVRGYQNYFSKKESLIISTPGQYEFTISDKPNNISLTLNRTILYESVDYTYSNTTGLLTIVNASFISQITTNSLLEARKIF